MRSGIANLVAAFLGAVTIVIASVPGALAQANYVIQSGDTLQIEVLEDMSLNRAVLVLPDGSINFPMAGTLRAAGRTVEQVRLNLNQALASSFAAPPTIYVSIASLSDVEEEEDVIDVYAIGEFEEPGRFEVKPGTTLLQFLAEAGGLSRFAADKRIELHRTDRRTGQVTTFKFNFRTPAGGSGSINGGTRLAPGDVVKVPQRRLFE